MQPTDYALGMPLVALGMILIVGGIVGLAWIFRYELGYDEPDVPPVVEPDPDRTAIISAVMPEPNYHRDDTHVFARIPGATPDAAVAPQFAALSRYLEAVDQNAETTAALTPIVGLREERIEEVPDEVLQRVRDGLAPKSAPEETQVVDLCPLTTQDIEVPFAEPAPVFQATFGEHPRAELGTQELSGSLARAKEQAA